MENHGYFSDWDQATEYANDIKQTCGDPTNPDIDMSCWNQGNRWSIIYKLNAITLFLLAANAGIMILGAWSFHARGLSACCASLLCCLNFGALVTTGVFRFNTFGKFS